jgi:large subunit ribosomal protein L35
MPKMKTRRAAAKRFRVTPKGKVLFQRSGLRHNLERMSGKERRESSRLGELAPEHVPAVRRLLGRR